MDINSKALFNTLLEASDFGKWADRFAVHGWNSFGLFAFAVAAQWIRRHSTSPSPRISIIQHKDGEDEPPQATELGRWAPEQTDRAWTRGSGAHRPRGRYD